MRLFLIRHAAAVPAGTSDIPDDERPLTPRGEKKWRRAAQGLAGAFERPDAVLSSPLPRAWRTAEIAAAAWGRLAATPAEALVTGHFPDWEALIEGRGPNASLALVGHEPHLSAFAGLLLRGSAFGPFKKGGVAVLDGGGSLRDGVRLVAFLPPRVLRRL